MDEVAYLVLRITKPFYCLIMASDNKQISNAGGAATNSGVEFQQRVAAWFLTIMHSAADAKAFLNIPDVGSIQAIRFETDTPIDDLVLVTDNADEVFFQIKRVASLSNSESSAFVGAMRQFVNQFLSRRDYGKFVLAVSGDASGKIRNTLRKLLDAQRLNPSAWECNPLSKADEECIETFREVVSRLFQDCGAQDLKQEDFLDFSKRVFVREYAVTAGMGHEAAAMAILAREAKISPELVWNSLISQALHFAVQRASITRDGLESLIGSFFGEDTTSAAELTMQMIFAASEEVPSDREIVLIEGFPDDNNLAVVEFHRFESDGSKRIRFREDRVYWDESNPAGSKLIHRSATMAGMNRWIEEHSSSFVDRDVYIIPANDSAEEVKPDFVKAHSASVKELMSENCDILKCIQCGKPLSQLMMSVVEIDDEDHEHSAGAVHDSCLQPNHRAIGQMRCPVFESCEYLKKFDLYRWIELRLHGQGAFNLGVGTQLGKPAFIGWNPGNERFRDDSYCIEVALADGTKRHVTSRGSIDRYNLENATKRSDFLNDQFEEAMNNQDPICYTSVNFSYARESLLLSIKEAEESLLECCKARVVPYTVTLGRLYDDGLSFYAPLCRLVRADNEQPLLLRGCQVVVTDPLCLPDYIKNWKNAKIDVPEYEMRILETDNAVDRWLAELFGEGEEPIVDPLCDRNGNLLSGFFIADVSSLRNPWDSV